MARVLVTGANGFIGRRLCGDLVAAGLAVRGARRAGHGGGLADVDYRTVGDIDETTDWREVLQDIDAVVHTAARVHILKETASDPLAAFRHVNVGGSLALARQALEAGVERFVFLSSIGARGDGAPLKPYQQSKREAEQALLALCADTAMNLVVLRPPLVYGADAPGNFALLQRAVAHGLPLPLGGIDNRRSLLYVGNLSDAVRSCLQRREPSAGIYELADPDVVSTPELARRIGAAMRRPARILSLPRGLLAAALTLAGRGAAVEQLTASLVVDNRDIEDKIGWHPPFTLDQGLAESLAPQRPHAG